VTATANVTVTAPAVSVMSVTALSSNTVNVVFNQPVKLLTTTGIQVKDLLGSDGTNAPQTAVLNSDNMTLVLTLQSGHVLVNANSGYSLILPASIVQSLATTTLKNTAQNLVFNGVATADTTIPDIASAIYDASSTTLSLTFSKPVDLSLANFNATMLTITDGTTNVPLTASDFQAASNGTTDAMILSSATAAKVAALTGSNLSIVVSAGAFQDAATIPNKAIAQTVSITKSTTPVVTGATYNQASNQLQVTFSTPVVLDYSKVSQSAFTLSDNGSTLALGSAALTTGANSNVVTLTLNATNAATINGWSNLTSSLQLSITTGAVQNAIGTSNKAATNQAVTFTADASAPTLTSASYNSGTQYLTLVFSKPVDLTAFTQGLLQGIAITDGTTTAPFTSATLASNLKTSGNSASTVVISYPSADVDTNTFVPLSSGVDLLTTKPWDVTFATGTFQDLVGNKIAALTQSSGSVVTFTDATAPTLNGSITVVDANHIQVPFIKNMDPVTSANPANYVITTTNNGTALNVTAASLGSDKKTVTLTTASQAAGQTYQLQINGVVDASGNKYVNITSAQTSLPTFTGTTAVSTASPVINSAYVYDVNNDQKIDQGDTIVLTYSKPISLSNVTTSDLVISNSHVLGTGATFAMGQYNNQLKITLGASTTMALSDTIGAPAGGTSDIVAVGGGAWNDTGTASVAYDPAIVSAPQVASAVVAHSKTTSQVSSGDIVTITLSQPVSLANSITNATVFKEANMVFDAGDTFTWSADQKSMAITLDSNDAGNFTAAKIAAGITVNIANDIDLVNGYAQTINTSYDHVTLKGATTTAPSLVSSAVFDTNNNGSIGSGDTLQLGFNGTISDVNASLGATDLVVQHGTLSTGDAVAVDSVDPTKLDITLTGPDSVTTMTSVNIGSLQTNITDAYANKVQPLTSGVVTTMGTSSVTPAAPVISTHSSINSANYTAYAGLSGTATAYSTIKITLADGASHSVSTTTTASSTGAWTIPSTDATTLNDGTINISITASNVSGNTSVAATSTALKDIVVPTMTAVTSGAYGLAAKTITLTVTGAGAVGDLVDVTKITVHDATTSTNVTLTTSTGVVTSATAVTITLSAADIASIGAVSGDTATIDAAAGFVKDAAGNVSALASQTAKTLTVTS